MAVLVDAADLATGDTVYLEMTGGAGGDGRIALVNLVVCGKEPSWTGVVLVTGTAAMSSPTFPEFPSAANGSSEVPAKFQSVSGVLTGAGQPLAILHGAEIYSVDLHDVFPCSPGIVGGEAWMLRGRTATSNSHDVTVSELRGARRFIALPGCGVIPGTNPSNPGEFSVPGLPGNWWRPLKGTYSTTVAASSTAVIESANPNDSTLVGRLHRSSPRAESTQAQIVDPNSQDGLRTLLSGATVILGVGAALLAAAVWELIRRRDHEDEPPSPEQARLPRAQIVQPRHRLLDPQALDPQVQDGRRRRSALGSKRSSNKSAHVRGLRADTTDDL